MAKVCVAVRRPSFMESEGGRAAGRVVAFCGGRLVCELLLSVEDVVRLCCVLSCDVWSPGRGVTTLIVLCEWKDDY